MPRSSASMPFSRYSGMKRMTEVWKPRQDTLPAMTMVTQTSTKMPYSKLPIQRARNTWLMKAMAARNDADGEGDDRHAAGLAALVGREQHGVDPAEQRPGTQREALGQKPVGGRCRGKTHATTLRFPSPRLANPAAGQAGNRPRPYAKLFKKRLGAGFVATPLPLTGRVAGIAGTGSLRQRGTPISPLAGKIKRLPTLLAGALAEAKCARNRKLRGFRQVTSPLSAFSTT